MAAREDSDKDAPHFNSNVCGQTAKVNTVQLRKNTGSLDLNNTNVTPLVQHMESLVHSKTLNQLQKLHTLVLLIPLNGTIYLG